MKYTYEVISVDKDLNIMEVKYTSEGLTDVTVSMPVPTKEQLFENVIRSYAPLNVWKPVKQTYQTVKSGKNGTIEIDPENPFVMEFTEKQLKANANREMFAQVEFEKRIAKTLLKFGVIDSDPTEIEVTKL